MAQPMLAEALAAIPEHRQAHRRMHDLVPLLVFSTAAMLTPWGVPGARSLCATAQWGAERRQDRPELLLVLGLRPGRSPSVATLHRVFKRLDVAAFERAVGTWLAQTGVKADDPVAIDGRALRGTHGERLPGVHLVSVYSVGSGAVLAQLAATGKGQELAATQAALAGAPLEGRLVGDALQTQRSVCEQIVAMGGDYLLLGTLCSRIALAKRHCPARCRRRGWRAARPALTLLHDGRSPADELPPHRSADRSRAGSS